MRAKLIGFSSLAAATVLLPALASAVTLFDTLGVLTTLLNGIIGLFIVLAVVTFFWGLIMYIFNMGGEGKEAASHGVRLMLWGVIALFVMVSIWGILGLLRTTFNVTSNTAMVPGGVNTIGVPGSGSGVTVGVSGLFKF